MVGHSRNPGLLLVGTNLGSRGAAIHHRAEILGRLNHRPLELDFLGELRGVGVQRLELKVALGDLVAITFDGTHGVDTVGEGNGLVLQLLEVVHV